MWVRVLAWLHAVPDDPNRKSKKNEPRRSRGEMLQGTPAAELPDLAWGRHLVDALLEVGPASAGMGGPVPISFQELDAWARVTHTDLPGHEALTLRELSRDYCRELNEASKPDRPRPAGDEKEARQAASDGFARLVRQLKQG